MDERGDAIREALLFRLGGEAAFDIDRLPYPGPALPGARAPRREEEAPGPPAGAGLDALREKALLCTSCPLFRTRKNVVFGEGNPEADLLFVGEAPGRDEDLSGRPFVGRAGKLLTRMIAAMGRSRSDVYIANVLKCRPPGNRTPNIEEIAACRHFLRAQIERIAPRVIVALVAPAARTLLAADQGISALRGRSWPYPADPTIPVVPTFHPAYLLRKEFEKPKAWQDLKLAMEILAEPEKGKPAAGQGSCPGEHFDP